MTKCELLKEWTKCTFKIVFKYGILKEGWNVHFWNNDQMCTFKRGIKYELLKELSCMEI